MKEQILNLFTFEDNDLIHHLGVKAHLVEGTDQEKINFLINSAKTDVETALTYKIPSRFLTISANNLILQGITPGRYRELSINESELSVFEEIFELHQASQSTLVVITPVVDGVIKIDDQKTLNPNPDNYPKGIVEKKAEDYLAKYLTAEGFDLPRMINDDFFRAIKLLYHNKLYVSSLKLLVVFIDSMAFLEFGNTPGNFKEWLNKYADLIPLSITAEELYEFRNSILHMTNLNSKKVADGKVQRISFYFANETIPHLNRNDELKYVNYKDLISVIAKALTNWTMSFGEDPSKMETFFDRYDQIVSDVRYTEVVFS